MMMSQIFKFGDFTKTEKSRYLKNETFFLQIKKFINYTSWVTLWQSREEWSIPLLFYANIVDFVISNHFLAILP